MSTRAKRWIAIASMLALGGCGPQIVLDQDATESDAGSTGAVGGPGNPGTSPPPPPTGGPVPPPPTTTSEATSGVATSVGDDSDVDDGPLDDGCFFGCSPDGGVLDFNCDLFAQDCPPAEKCMPWGSDYGVAWNATRCSPLEPFPEQLGEPCMIMGLPTTGIDNCAEGTMCWNVDELGQGICEDICSGSADAPECVSPSDRCVIANDGAIALCLPACDPLLQDCAVANESCVAAGEHWVCVPAGSDTPGAHGAPCDFVNACDPGAICVGASDIEAFPGMAPPVDCDDAVGCCAAVCDASDPLADAACAALDPAHTCELWRDPDAPPGSNPTLGVCGLAR